MKYISCVLSRDTTALFARHVHALNNDHAESDHYFERAKTFDDVELIIVLKNFFDVADRIRLGRFDKMTSARLSEIVKSLENGEMEYLVSLIDFDKEFVLNLIEYEYYQMKNADKGANISEVISEILRHQRDGQIV